VSIYDAAKAAIEGAIAVYRPEPSPQYLEPLYDDFRKIRYMDKMGKMQASNVDQFVDELMTSERICDIILPRLQQRHVLEELGDVCAPKGLFLCSGFLRCRDPFVVYYSIRP
jgi:hypothetical protein